MCLRGRRAQVSSDVIKHSGDTGAVNSLIVKVLISNHWGEKREFPDSEQTTVVPLICGFAFCGSSYSRSTTFQNDDMEKSRNKQFIRPGSMILLLTYRQKGRSSRTLHHNAQVIHTSSQHVNIVSHSITRRRVSTGQKDTLRDHIHITYDSILL